ncbi:MAG TPA: hypothetical protein VIY73_26675 [Polyangiaceae bacterium]
MRMPCLVLLVSCASFFAAGCSSGSAPPPRDAGTPDGHAGGDGGGAGEGGARDAAVDAASSADAGGNEASASDAGAACHDLGNAAPAITIQQVVGDPPAPEGGAIADGTYWLTAATIYTGDGDAPGPSGSAHTTVRIAGTTMDVAASGTPPTRTLTLTTNGTSITAADTCPDTETSQATYSATATTLVFILPGGSDDAGTRTVVETYTKQ